MKILVIDEEFPYPLNTGKRIRSFNLTRQIAWENDVTYLAYGNSDSEGAKALADAGVHPEAVEPPGRRKSGAMFYARLLGNLFSKYPYIVTSHYTSRFQSRLRELVSREAYDIILCEWTPYAQFVRDLPSPPKKVIVAHNIESTIWKRYHENESDTLKRYYIGIQHRKVLDFERACFGWADGATAVTAQEARTIRQFGTSYEPAVVDNGVDVEYFQPLTTEVRPKRVVFTGSMDWRPNQDAAVYFVKDILPLIRQREPLIEAVFVGRNPAGHVVDLGRIPEVTITGTVDDVRTYIAESSVYIVPLRIGGGSRLKILEAMAMRKPVVSTSVGAEGLEVTDGRDILLADSPQAFADTVLELLDNESKKANLAEQGYRLVHSRYRWEQLGVRLNKYLRSVAGIP